MNAHYQTTNFFTWTFVNGVLEIADYIELQEELARPTANGRFRLVRSAANNSCEPSYYVFGPQSILFLENEEERCLFEMHIDYSTEPEPVWPYDYGTDFTMDDFNDDWDRSWLGENR